MIIATDINLQAENVIVDERWNRGQRYILCLRLRETEREVGLLYAGDRQKRDRERATKREGGKKLRGKSYLTFEN